MDNTSTTSRRKRGPETPERVSKRAKTGLITVDAAVPVREPVARAATAAAADTFASRGLPAPIRIAGPSAWALRKVLMKLPRSPPLKSPRKSVAAEAYATTPRKVVARVPRTPSRSKTSITPTLTLDAGAATTTRDDK